jgi:hypothetical protein
MKFNDWLNNFNLDTLGAQDLARMQSAFEAGELLSLQVCADLCRKYAKANEESDIMVDAFMHCTESILALKALKA